jgi:hypothetical protein
MGHKKKYLKNIYPKEMAQILVMGRVKVGEWERIWPWTKNVKMFGISLYFQKICQLLLHPILDRFIN